MKNNKEVKEVIRIPFNQWDQKSKKYDLSNAHVSMNGKLKKPMVIVTFL